MAASDSTYDSICSQELSIKNFYAIYEKIKPLSARWKQIAISLRIKIDTINRIEVDCRGDTITCLQKVIECWLKKDYDYESHGSPCWRRVCVAVKEGGGDSALADEIASEHHLLATTGGVSPYPLPATTESVSPNILPATTGATTGGVSSYILPATTGGVSPYPLPATTGGVSPYILPATTGGVSPYPLPATTGGISPYILPATTGGISRYPLPVIGSASTNLRVSPSGSTGEAMSPGSGKSNKSTRSDRYGFSEKSFHLASKLHDLQDEFDEAIRITKKSFKSSDLPEVIDYLNTHALSLLGPKKKQQTTVQAIRNEFKQVGSVSELFTVLQDKYISWFNYKLIIKIVGVFLHRNRSLKRIWSSYEEKLKDYFINSGGLLKDADAVQFGVKGVPPGTRVMIAKVDRDDYTLDDLFFFRRAIPQGLDVPEYDIYFSFIHIGSLCLGYLIHDYAYSFLFPLTTKQQQKLFSIGITELTCGEYIYDKEDLIEEIKHLSTDIDICDPLWYENTSTPLHEAAWRGLKDEVQWLLSKFGYTTYHRGLHGWTPLHSASYGGHIEILQLLIHQYGIDPNEGDDNSVSSIHMASYKGYLSIVHYLVDTCHIPPDQPDNSNNTALLYSALGGHPDLVEFFIERNCNASQINCISASVSLLACISGNLALVHKLESLDLFSPDSKDLVQSTVLHYSCMNKNAELFKYLLDQYQLFINAKDKDNKTPLHTASWYASSSIVEYILSIQGNEALLVTDNIGYSSLHYACNASSHIPAGIVFGKLFAQRDASIIEIINYTRIKQNVNFMKRKERVKLFSLLLNKASTCPNFDINATTNDGRSLLHLASRSGSTLLNALDKYTINCTLDDYGRSPVHYAAWSGSTSALVYVISQYNLNVNDTDYTYGYTPLAYSCWSGSINSVKYLINNHSSNPSITDRNGTTCLHRSCRNGHIDITEYLIEVQHCDINKTDNEGKTLVHHAASSGNFDLVQYLITEQGLSPTAVDKDGLTALHYASMSHNLSLVKELITTYQLDPHQANSKGLLPVLCAAQSGNILVLEIYTKDYKCSLSVTDSRGWNIIHFSSFKVHTHFIKHITSQHPQYTSLIHSTNNDGKIPLHLACETGNIQLVTFLINDMKCDVNAKDTRDQTCVTFACFSGNLDLVQLLIQQYKLDPLAVDKYGFTALHAAAGSGHTHLLEWYSQEYSVDITNHTNNNKYSLAHEAAYKGKLHCLQQLINKYQCDVNATTTDTGSTVLHRACAGGQVPDVVLYLTSLPQCNVEVKTSNGSTGLHITCQYSGSLPILKHLVENHQLDLCAVNDEGMAPIHLACSNGRLNLVEYIIEHIPSSLELPHSKHGHTPFLIAAYSDQIEVIKYLISKKCNLSATNGKGSGAVHISVEKGHLNVLKYLFNNNYCNPNATDHQERTPLHVAIPADQLDSLSYLLSKSIPSMSVAWLREIKHLLDSYHAIYNNPHNAVLINVQDKDGNTPLHVACQGGKQNMVSLLLKASLSHNNLLITNKKGQTPLHLAAAYGHKDAAEALLFSVTGSSTHGDLLTATDNERSTVLHVACSNGHIDVFRYLSSIYPEGVNAMDNRGRGLLHAACEGEDIGIVRTLIETHGLDPLAEDEDGITCLHLLAERKRVYIYQYLEPNIVSNPVPKDKSGRTPLHYASRSDNIHMVRYLIETFPCTPDDPDNNGYTSVHGACEAGSMELVQYFLTELNCNPLAETDDLKTLIYYASMSSNLELVRILVTTFSLKPRPHDIEIAQSVNPDSSVVKYLQKIYDDMIFDMMEEEKRMKETHQGKHEQQQISPQKHDIVS
uniref:Uncharacterized protein n=1 Tax=Amphimedon queenslandica TaxID=400682 RepID=A0A1X7TVU5_AMPQE